MGLKLKGNQPIGRIIPDTNKVKSRIVNIQLVVSQLQYWIESVKQKTSLIHAAMIDKETNFHKP
ncbi:hypothetical protein P872_04845 [Rhodonellum psychrophilum GCM71 = DSM 17998]|uniref:Uncharacterized protein n=1 Tax=Rhodonellum psychrophilum GCM71 = DSM 17998 TaxID=1123057 RepID=U5BYM7_9BACT|nr:hypothetical protein P872_04845 [Rhodonellum psychrophilum GCM71 = DSM 17998]